MDSGSRGIHGEARRSDPGREQCSHGEVGFSRKKIISWLDEFKIPVPPGEKQNIQTPPEYRVVEKIWIRMGGKIDYAALPILCEIYGVTDVEELLVQLVAIRDFEWPKTSQ